MHRREFLAGCGALATGGTAGAALRDDRFAVNPAPLGISHTSDATVAGQGLFLGYIPGSAETLVATQPGEQPGWRDLLAADRRAELSIRRLVATSTPSIERIDVTVNFALADTSRFVPFHAWQFVALPGSPARQSSPISFTSGVPESAILSIAYRLRNPHDGQPAAGALHYRIGGSGLGPGIYALAAPTRSTGAAPDWSALAWENGAGCLARRDGAAIDFDYLVLALAPAVA